jgi:hypothetical protein
VYFRGVRAAFVAIPAIVDRLPDVHRMPNKPKVMHDANPSRRPLCRVV